MFKTAMAALAAIFVSTVSAQTTINPQCVTSFILTSGSPNSTGFDNRFTGCDNWRITWETFGSTPAATVTFQQAPSNTAGTAAATWTTFGGSIVVGSNPSTSTLGQIAATGYSPWVRVRGTAITGTVRGLLLGCRLPCDLASAGGGGGGGNVVVTNTPLPVTVSGTASVVQTPVCSSRASFLVSATAGSALIVNPSGSTSITVCHISFASDTAANFKLVQGTGAGCSVGPGDLTGFYQNVLALSLDLAPNPIVTAAGQGLCVNSSVSATYGGMVIYNQN